MATSTVCERCERAWYDCVCLAKHIVDSGHGTPLIPVDSDVVSSTVSARAGHSEQVYEWRKDQFQRLGYNVARAEFLADSHIEVGLARKMRKQGCSLELLEEILLGTCFAGEDERWYRDPALVYEEEVVEDGA